jgi:glutathione S-transferase
MLKIWGRSTSANVQKVLWMVDEIGLAYERIDAGGRFGGLDTPAYRALNPNARVPTVEDNGVVVWESNAILRYLAARYSEGNLWDRDPGARAQVDQWMDWMQTTLAPDYYGLFWAAVRSAPERRNPAAIKEHARLLAEHYRLLDRLLAGRSFLLGDRLSLADIAIGVTLYRYHQMDVERPQLANFAAWYARLAQRPAFRNQVMTSFEELRGRSQN